MLSFLPSFLKGPLAGLLVTLNTVFWFVPVLLVGILKWMLPITAWRKFCTRILTWLAVEWTTINNFVIHLTQDIEWDVQLPEGLDRRGHYLLIANHQSWTDIVVLQKVFHKRIPFLKFFLKRELIWVPLLGIAWWALDLPFMRRYSIAELKRHPEKRGEDLEITRRACERFKHLPLTLTSFLEGTRFSDQKRERQQSPYRHLLKPKAGGIAFALNALDGSVPILLDATIVYSPRQITFIDLFMGRVKRITVRVAAEKIPEQFLHGNYQQDDGWRRNFQAWIRERWQRKDAEIENLVSKAAGE